MSTFNVLRYSFLGAGLFYGAFHRYSLESAQHEEHATKQWKHEEKLIRQAKAEYAKLHAPKVTKTEGAINWEDPNLDFGKVLEGLVQKLD
ncbi:uncharacterized protein CANTADRAFT_54282 [Suhomyces tanzawaensis NRRL Y-17324]|uniref:ATP synthase F(0) complex subunit e, mitochondrial n=1 Tax=Suhomyces tanzawaensis NRRL Y-17324 TaxID=984487 RepID=A0A1E4SE70_9ASCO|nr:uncharacterized protein CANTADRAFT_54282 [Suhomyces tanzawaensis NRRL Y-17324]ODV77692.1 hypothetical protein CANTADRAFT_54282 [Suhomyces tanzawaensis NRRL Y-17324]